MNLTLYKMTENPLKVSKNPIQIGTAKTLTPTGEISIENPVFLIDFNSSFLPCNYCYCSDFGKYYFVQISLEVGGKIKLMCEEDYLNTWKTAIYNAKGIILRSESIGKSTMIPDNKLPIDPNRYEIKSIKFPFEFEPYYEGIDAYNAFLLTI